MPREPEEQALHDHFITLLHKEYYRYPDPSHPHLITFVNHPLKRKAVRGPDGAECSPDVLVLATDSEQLVMVAEVETESTLDEAEAREWAEFSRLCGRFYLYFPKGFGPRVVALCAGLSVTEFIQYHKEGDRYILQRYE